MGQERNLQTHYHAYEFYYKKLKLTMNAFITPITTKLTAMNKPLAHSRQMNNSLRQHGLTVQQQLDLSIPRLSAQRQLNSASKQKRSRRRPRVRNPAKSSSFP